MPTERRDGVPLEERTDGGRRPAWRLNHPTEAAFSVEGIGSVEISEGDFDELAHGQTLEQFFGESFDPDGNEARDG